MLLNPLHVHGPDLLKDTKAPIEGNYLFELASFFYSNRPQIVLLVQGCKLCVFRALNISRSATSLEQCKLTEATPACQPRNFSEARDGQLCLVFWIDNLVNFEVERRFLLLNQVDKLIHGCMLIKVIIFVYFKAHLLNLV